MGERKPKPIDAALVRQLFDYSDGVLSWKVKKGRANIGDTAWTNSTGYKLFRFCGEQYQEHRLIWAWHYGDVPDGIDHINGDFLDNRVENLRPATHRQNMCNRKTPSHNKTGVKGVYMSHGKYRAQITKDGNVFTLGSFLHLAEAKTVVENARKGLHMEFAKNG